MIKKNLPLTFAISVFAAAFSQGAVIVGYDFGPDTAAGATFAVTTSATGVSGTAITKGAGIGQFRATNVLGYATDSALQLNPNNFNSAAAAVVGNAYFTFEVTPDASQTINLSSLTFNAARGGGPTRGYDVRSSIDGFASTLGTADLLTQRPTFTAVSIDLSGSQFSGLTTATEFRVYVYTPSIGSSVEFDDIELNGTVTAVPEPSSGLLAALGGLLLARRKRAE